MAQTGRKPVTVSFYIRECGAVLIGALATVLFLSLLSYVPAEAIAQSSDGQFSNVIGSVGEVLAFVMFWPFGEVAFLLPFGMLYFCVLLLRWRDPNFEWSNVARKAVGVVLGLLSLAILATLFNVGWSNHAMAGGGAIGQLVVDNLVALINFVGLYVASIVLLMISLQLTWQFSWLTALEKTGHAVVLALGWMAIAFQLIGQLTRSLYRSIANKLKTTRTKQALTVSKTPNRDRVTPTLIPKAPDPTPQIETLTPAEVVSPQPAKAPPSDRHEPSILSKLPSIEILSTRTEDLSVTEAEKQALITLGERLQAILADYGVAIEVDSIISGPVVSRFELQLAPGLKVNKITALGNDLAREIAVSSVRVVQVIPGKSVVGIEIPNKVRATVTLREVLAQPAFKKTTVPLTLALGKDISGEPVYADLERMPHLLVAGTTGSGKSVGVNTMLLSLLYRLTPEDVRLILVDPKMLELSVYEGIPHLLTPVVTDMQDAAKALQWCVLEMERRYRLMMELKVRNLRGFNEKIEEAARAGEYIPDPLFDPESGGDQEALTRLPLIVVVIDEFADMIMIVGKKIEQLIARIAQKARAAGIHLVLATQRPSVDVITGLIKANIPSRISYQVSSQVDSRTILDQVGAEQLLGHGDMLYLPPGSSVPERVHGAFVSDEEVLAVIEDWRKRGSPDYVYDVVSEDTVFDISDFGFDVESQNSDDVFQDAVKFVLETRRASASALQTKFQIGWNKASRLMDQMAKQGIVSEPDQKGRREVLTPAD